MKIRHTLVLAAAAFAAATSAHAGIRPLAFDAAALGRARATAPVTPLAVRTASALDLKMNAPLRALLEQAGVATPDAATVRGPALTRDAAIAAHRGAR